LTVLVPSAVLAQGAQAARRAEVTVAATLAARQLIDTPPGERRPPELAARITRLTDGTCGADVHDAAALEEASFGGLLSVGRGSTARPCLVELRYEPADPLGHVVLCGKGMTFGSGGLALHGGDRLATGKTHVAGAAVVAAACSVLGELGVRVRVTALLPLVESMPDGDAQRPGDVVTTRGGATIEITDGAADTVLALADTLDLARAYEPDAIVDVATVGPSASTALGRFAGAVMGTDQVLVDSLLAAADLAGEPLWQLPLWDDLDRFVDSTVADMANHASRVAGTPITTALILRRFVKGVPWAHIDCGGPSHIPTELDVGGTHRAGATGYGVRTLLAWLEHHTAHAG
jgi:leucyl aminopeptidase